MMLGVYGDVSSVQISLCAMYSIAFFRSSADTAVAFGVTTGEFLFIKQVYECVVVLLSSAFALSRFLIKILYCRFQ